MSHNGNAHDFKYVTILSECYFTPSLNSGVCFNVKQKHEDKIVCWLICKLKDLTENLISDNCKEQQKPQECIMMYNVIVKPLSTNCSSSYVGQTEGLCVHCMLLRIHCWGRFPSTFVFVKNPVLFYSFSFPNKASQWMTRPSDLCKAASEHSQHLTTPRVPSDIHK